MAAHEAGGRGQEGEAAARGGAGAWDEARNVLCVRLDALGDVLMSGPAMRALAAVRPDRSLTLLSSPAGAAAGALLPWVDEVIVCQAPWVKPTGAPANGAIAHRQLAAELRRRRFDAAVIFTVYSQSPLPAALACHLADIPLRLAHCRENPYDLLSDWIPEPEPEDRIRHEVRRQLDLVAAVGATAADDRLELDIPTSARERVAGLLGELGLTPGRRWAAVHPGSSAPSRRYPPEAFASACTRLAGEHGVATVFTGGEPEKDAVDAIRSQLTMKSHSLAGELDVPELAALIAAAPVLVAGNTGPVHMAAAVGTPVVDLYALTNPQHGPWRVPSAVLFHDVPCRWCYKSVCPEGHHRCLRGVPPEAVADAAAALLDGDEVTGNGPGPLGLWRRHPHGTRRPPQRTPAPAETVHA